MRITCLLRNLYASLEATVRILHETLDWLKIGKGVQGGILSPCVFNLCAVCVCARLPSCFSHVQLFVTLWTVAFQAPRSLAFSRQEY